MQLPSKQNSGFFERLLAKRLTLKNRFFAVLTGLILFIAQNLVQFLLSGNTWFLDVYEITVEIGLGIFASTIQFLFGKYSGKQKQKKIRDELHGKSFTLANYAMLKDEIHNFNGILFLDKNGIHFKGHYYSKEKNLEIAFSNINYTAINKVFGLERGFKIFETNGKEWHFLTEEPNIWIKAIQQEISVISKRDN